MTVYCEHYDCRCDAAEELAFMSDALHRPDLLAKAVEVFFRVVRCRHVPRKGPIPMPFAAEERRDG